MIHILTCTNMHVNDFIGQYTSVLSLGIEKKNDYGLESGLIMREG